MYKLMLVDDEEEVRKGIMEEIDWEAYGFTIVGEAENGRDALELAERVSPDVVITDIKMPFMDGLQLSQHLKELFSNIKILILTGFDEFQFAQKAVKLNVNEYVLKPIVTKELISVLHKIKSEMDEEISRIENLNALKERIRKSLPILREKFLASLITKKMTFEEIRDKAYNYELNLEGQNFIVSVISIDNYDVKLRGMENNEDFGPKIALKDSTVKELKLFAVLNIVEEIVNKYNLGIIFMFNDSVIVISKSLESDKCLIVNRTLQVLEEIRTNTQRYLKLTITVGTGTICEDITNLSHSYNDAMLALDYRLILGNDRVIWIDDVEKHNSEKIELDEMKEQALIRCLKVGTISELRNIIDSLFSDVENNKVCIKDYHVYLLELFTTILKVTKGGSLNLDNILGGDFKILSEILKFNNIADAKEWFTGLCIRIMEYISYDRQKSCKSIVNKAKEFIAEHFHENDLTINKVSNFLHISSGYFSSIYKKETKMTFLNYLMHIRMDAAKELLRTTDLMAFEISEKVGFSEAYYFSHCFKKNVGITPKQYRNRYRGD